MTKPTKEQQAYERGYQAGFEAGKRSTIDGIFKVVGFPSTETQMCNCHPSKRGQITAGWICPVHGQQF